MLQCIRYWWPARFSPIQKVIVFVLWIITLISVLYFFANIYIIFIFLGSNVAIVSHLETTDMIYFEIKGVTSMRKLVFDCRCHLQLWWRCSDIQTPYFFCVYDFTLKSCSLIFIISFSVVYTPEEDQSRYDIFAMSLLSPLPSDLSIFQLLGVF